MIITNNRRQFGSLNFDLALPDLIEVQRASYNWLFEEGLRELLDEISPVTDFTGKNYQLTLGEYGLDDPKVDEEQAKRKNQTFKAPLRIKVKLENLKTNKIKESEVFLGDFPVMTDRGTFIINGIERVVVSQIIRSYGVIFIESLNRDGKISFGAKLIPARGAWLEFETSARGVISVKVDRKRKISVATFLHAISGLDRVGFEQTFNPVDLSDGHSFVKATVARDQAASSDEAAVEVYKRIRPGDLANPEGARTFIETLFFDPKRYSLSSVGRYHLNRRLNINVDNKPENHVLRPDDVIEIIKEIIRLNNDPQARPDDIDHLKNRRLRTVGELIANRLRVGLLRMERIIKDRMSMIEPNQITPVVLVNNRPIMAILQEFFASSQLSQFMDQTNPLSELEHKRRLAATGPGGLSRERAGFEVRDVHRSHYGRICPITTPEGPNIGLVSQLATYARVNRYGFIETPYRRVVKQGRQAKVTGEIVYLDAFDEERHTIAPVSTKLNSDGTIAESRPIVRVKAAPALAVATQIEYMDVSPKQIVSVTAGLIPFIENDDAVRASMGSNMLRQAVPTIKPDSPIVGTGLELAAAHYSGQLIEAQQAGEVVQVDSNSISVKGSTGTIVYPMIKFSRSNQGTSFNQRPVVTLGDKVKSGQMLADSSATDNGELSLGQNLLVAFMSFDGANYEDSIIISERLVHEDVLTSVHIEKFSIEVRDTKLGPELLTRDIPNVGEGALAELDDDGIIRLGAEVKSGDILIGKISPKGETELSAEEKLLRAIFGDKAKEVMDTSLRLPHGEYGKVVDVRIFSRDAGDELTTGVIQMVEVHVAQLRKIQVGDKLAGRHGNKGVISKILPIEDMPHLPDGRPVDIILNPLGVISRMNLGQILETHLGWAANKLGYKVASPAFNGIPFDRIKQELKKADLSENGKTTLFDGRTGQPYSQQITVGFMYVMKLIHLVDDKIHARSTGPYSMVTQQPLGGKAQFGGQRFGEMEVWALEAYGAAHSLQEMLTIKSDDIFGRSKAYESVIKRDVIQKPSTPASFMVFVRELQALGLNLEMMRQGRPVSIDQPTVSPELEKKAVIESQKK